jgi:hypothetical protein
MSISVGFGPWIAMELKSGSWNSSTLPGLCSITDFFVNVKKGILLG